MAVCKSKIDSSILYCFSCHYNQISAEAAQGRKNSFGFKVQRTRSIMVEKAWCQGWLSPYRRSVKWLVTSWESKKEAQSLAQSGTRLLPSKIHPQ